MILELCKGVHFVDLGESFQRIIQTHIYLQNLASIQPRTSPLKFDGWVGSAQSAWSFADPARAYARGCPGCSEVRLASGTGKPSF